MCSCAPLSNSTVSALRFRNFNLTPLLMSLRESRRTEQRSKASCRSCQKYLTRWLRLHQRWIISLISRNPNLSLTSSILILLTAAYCWYLILSSTFSSHVTVTNYNGRTYFEMNEHKKYELEKEISTKYVCERKQLEDNVVYLKRCSNNTEINRQKTIVALIEVRNVEPTIEVFLKSLVPIVDKVLVLDDYSNDYTRHKLLSFQSDVEIHLLNKSGEGWQQRQELYDRQMLLNVGRFIGGTHFILIDYDEYFSSNCITNNLLRNTILTLRPTQSLYIPWVEVWKSFQYQAVSKYKPINFLNRKQIIIFADDGKFQYTKQNSIAKIISSSTNSSIHVLRCPRTICPTKFNLNTNTNIKSLLHCRIIEMRFLNLNNVLLKSIWYESLGRVMNVTDGVTSGKMINILYNNFIKLDQNNLTFNIVKTRQKWFTNFDSQIERLHSKIELWRANELVKWFTIHGYSKFIGLKMLSLMDINEFHDSLQLIHKSNSNQSLTHVPKKKVGNLFITIDLSNSQILNDFLSTFDLSYIYLNRMKEYFDKTLEMDRSQAENENEEPVRYKWKSYVTRTVMNTLKTLDKNYLFISCNLANEQLVNELIDIVRDELEILKVYIIFGNRIMSNETNTNKIFRQALSYSLEAGSHLSLLDIPVLNFGSATSLLWICNRIFEKIKIQDINVSKIIDFAEYVHQKYDDTFNLAPIMKLIFSLNVGRSGSNHLANVFSTSSDNVIALHEPGCPNKECTKGGGMRMQDQLLSSTYDKRKRIKSNMIHNSMIHLLSDYSNKNDMTVREECSNLFNDTRKGDKFKWKNGVVYEINHNNECELFMIPDSIYVETNPNFKSWFYDIVLDTYPNKGYEIHVIIIRKYINAVLKSLYETGFFSVKNGYTWMETLSSINTKFHATTAGTNSILDDSKLNSTEKLLSYILNSEATFRYIVAHYKNHRHIHFYHTKAEELYQVDGILKLFNVLNVGVTSKTIQAASQVHDKYLSGKKRIGHIPMEECEDKVRQFIDRNRSLRPQVGDFLKMWSAVEGFAYSE